MISPVITPRRIGRLEGQLDDIQLVLTTLIKYQLETDATEAIVTDMKNAKLGALDALEALRQVQDQLRQRPS